MWKALSSLFRRLTSAYYARHQDSAEDSQAGLPQERIAMVALLGNSQDRELLSRLAAAHRWTVFFAETCGGAWDILNSRKVPIALCDRELAGTEWRDVIPMMTASPHPVYAILVSRVADDYLWNEVIRHGGHDLIASPLRQDDVVRAIRLAWTYWSSSMRVPPMLLKHYR